MVIPSIYVCLTTASQSIAYIPIPQSWCDGLLQNWFQHLKSASLCSNYYTSNKWVRFECVKHISCDFLAIRALNQSSSSWESRKQSKKVWRFAFNPRLRQHTYFKEFTSVCILRFAAGSREILLHHFWYIHISICKSMGGLELFGRPFESNIFVFFLSAAL